MRNSAHLIVLALYGVNLVVHLVAQIVGNPELADWTQWIAMPLLIGVVLGAQLPTTRLVKLTLVALFFSWLGDVIPHFFDGETSFLVLVGCFFLAQIAYIAGFAPYWRESYARSPMVLVYVAIVALLIYLVAPHAGSLLIPVLIYGLALGTMAVLASGVHPLTMFGGALFLISDALIAIGAFNTGVKIPHPAFWIMSTYLIGQALIAYGVLKRTEAEAGVAAR